MFDKNQYVLNLRSLYGVSFAVLPLYMYILCGEERLKIGTAE